MKVESTITTKKESQITSHKVVIPFYIYAAASFFISTIILLISSKNIHDHYFQPQILSLTHLMALGWGTMIIIGSSFQLIPVLIEHKLYSYKLARFSFYCLSISIPLLVIGFYNFKMDIIPKWGGRLIILGIIAFIINIYKSIHLAKVKNIHSVYILAASCWLFITISFGLLLVYNFSFNFFNRDSLDFLSLHAHVGILGWFLMLIIGVSSRLLPMFFISKYENSKLLWVIFLLLNAGLILFIIVFLFFNNYNIFIIPTIIVALSIILYIRYCYKVIKQRLRKKIEDALKLSVFSTIILVLPILILLLVLSLLIIFTEENKLLIFLYGFIIFFGWITSIILGMTFKTLPFIIWSKVYHNKSIHQKSPNPSKLYNHVIFKLMSISYLLGILLFTISYLLKLNLLIQFSMILLVLTAFFYNWNVIKLIRHKPSI